MSWVVLVDGYNVLQSWPQFAHQLETQFELARNRLIRMVANFADFQGHRVVVVFDAPRRDYPKVKRKKQEGLEVVYTKRNQTADDYIIRWIKRYKGGKHIEVITSDRELGSSVRRLGASVRNTFEFSDSHARTDRIQRHSRPQAAIPDSEPRLRDRIDPDVRRQLEKLRQKLAES
jgi:uncharacterized protein